MLESWIKEVLMFDSGDVMAVLKISTMRRLVVSSGRCDNVANNGSLVYVVVLIIICL